MKGSPLLKTVPILVLIPFSVLSAAALWQVCYLDLFIQQFANYGLQKVLADLVIAVFLCMYLMWRDSKKSRRNPWPCMLLSLLADSFGPVLYLITRKARTISAPADGLAASGERS